MEVAACAARSRNVLGRQKRRNAGTVRLCGRHRMYPWFAVGAVGKHARPPAAAIMAQQAGLGDGAYISHNA